MISDQMMASPPAIRQLPSERDWLVVVPRSQGGLTYLIFVSPARDFELLSPTFRNMLDSLQLQ